MAPQAWKKQLGKGMRCSILIKYLCPSQEVAQAIPNATDQQRLEDLIATCLGEMTRQGQTYPAVFFTSATISGIQLSAAVIKTIVREEGHPDGIWGDAGIRLPRGEALVEAALNKQADISNDIFTAQNVAEDIACIRGEGFEVDDDNNPAPEKIPANRDVQPINLDLYEGQSWGWDGIDRHITMGGRN